MRSGLDAPMLRGVWSFRMARSMMTGPGSRWSRRILGHVGVVAHLLAWLLVVLPLMSCSSPSPEGRAGAGADAPPAVSEAVTGAAAGLSSRTWSLWLAGHPEALSKLFEESSDQGWARLYEHDWPAARGFFAEKETPAAKLGLARAHLAEAEFFQAAYELALEVDQQYQKMALENANRLKRSDLDGFADGVRALRTGKGAEAEASFKAFRASASSKNGRLAGVAAAFEGASLMIQGRKADAEVLWKTIPPGDAAARAALACVRLEGGGGAEAVKGLELPDTPIGRRLLFYAQAKAGELQAASDTLRELDHKVADYEESVTLEEGESVRRFTDPIVLKGLVLLHAGRARKGLEGVPGGSGPLALSEKLLGGPVTGQAPAQVDEQTLPAFIFSRFPTPEDYAARLGGGSAGYLAGFDQALGPVPAGAGDGRDTRMAVVAGEAFLDAARKGVEGLKKEEGSRIVADLKLLENDVRLAIRARAEAYRAQGKTLEALFLLEHTYDKDNSTKITFTNDPILFIRIVRAYVALGRYREALNYLYRLSAVRSELWFVQESLGNLSVLDTVDRAGRSGGQD